jgi:hypothetical protein
MAMAMASPHTQRWAIALGDGLRRAAAGEPSRFTVAWRDASGKPLASPDPSQLRLSIEPLLAKDAVAPSGEAQPVHIQHAAPERDGKSLAASFVATRAGEHQLHVALSGTPVHGSPFRLSVVPGPTDAQATTARGAGLLRALVGEEAAFVITALDAFGNQRPCGGDPFEARVHLPKDRDDEQPAAAVEVVEVVDCEDGTYLGLFTLPRGTPAQNCILDVHLAGAPIDGSPFRIAVEA